MRIPATLMMAVAVVSAAPVPPVVHRGERLLLSAQVGAVVASVDAEALQDGAPGDTIRVRNLQNGKMQTARVIHAGLAEVLR